jgi:ABC-type lipoprotein release transport system permease subunit
MNIFILSIKELLYRKISTLVILLTVVFAVTVTTAIFSMSRASENETRKIMREQGLNMYIYPDGVDTLDLFAGSIDKTMPESYIETIATAKTFDAMRHLVGILQLKLDNWKDPNGSTHKILLLGYKDEANQIHLKKQKTMGLEVSKGKVRLGSDIAQNIPEGSLFTITGADGKQYSFEVEKRMPEGQGPLDKSAAFNLSDLQNIMNLPGQINKIEALGCTCEDGRMVNARRQIGALLEGVQIKELYSIAEAREKQRLMIRRYASFIIPFIIFACVIIAGLTFFQNISTRKYEIAILKAHGKSRLYIITLISIKSILIGVLGAVIGFIIGTETAGYFGKEIFTFTGKHIRPAFDLLILSIAGAPLFCLAASWIPALLAAVSEVAEVLKGE